MPVKKKPVEKFINYRLASILEQFTSKELLKSFTNNILDSIADIEETIYLVEKDIEEGIENELDKKSIQKDKNTLKVLKKELSVKELFLSSLLKLTKEFDKVYK